MIWVHERHALLHRFYWNASQVVLHVAVSDHYCIIIIITIWNVMDFIKNQKSNNSNISHCMAKHQTKLKQRDPDHTGLRVHNSIVMGKGSQTSSRHMIPLFWYNIGFTVLPLLWHGWKVHGSHKSSEKAMETEYEADNFQFTSSSKIKFYLSFWP